MYYFNSISRCFCYIFDRTARLIDKMLTEEFVHCTILHISHDLAAIMHYDKVLVSLFIYSIYDGLAILI